MADRSQREWPIPPVVEPRGRHVKEPTRGSLGRSDAGTLEEIAHVVAGQAPLSVALGEWHQSKTWMLPPNIAWAKVGFSRCSTSLERHRGWLAWLKTQRKLQATRLIGVVYADRKRVNSPCFAHILDWVESTKNLSEHLPGILIDTAIKDGHGLLTWQSLDTLRRYQDQCRRHGLFLALAGSLTFADVLLLKQSVQPDVIAVRGAACAGNARAASIQLDRVRSLAQCLRAGF